MAILSVGMITQAGIAEALAAAAGGGDSFPNTGHELFAIKNAGGAPITVTFKAGILPCNFGVAGTPAHDVAVSVTNDSAIYLFGPFATQKHNDANARVQVTYSGVTSVTVGVFSMPNTN